MREAQETLDEIYKLIEEQFKTIQGKLNAEEVAEYVLRSQLIKELIERLGREEFGEASAA